MFLSAEYLQTRLLKYFMSLSRNRILWHDFENFSSSLPRKPIFLPANLDIHATDTCSFKGYSGHNKYMLP